MFFLFILISKIKNFICYEVFFIFIFRYFCRSLFIMARFSNTENWKCFNQIIAKSAEDKISLKAALEISPSYFLKAKNKKTTSKIRIVADACFR